MFADAEENDVRSESRTAAHILLADDDQDVRRVVTTALSEEGYVVLQAENGHRALELATVDRLDLILLDVRMPEMDGQVFADVYRSLPVPHAPILLVTGLPPIEAAQQTEAIGARGFLRKPLNLDELLATVNDYVSLQRLRQGTTPEPDASPVAATRRRGTTPPPDAVHEAQRRRELQRLRERLVELQASLSRVHAATRELAEIELHRKLNPAETRRARQLRWESEHLRFELQILRERFEALAGRRGGEPSP
jgi:CheY-like chemotaxis protein